MKNYKLLKPILHEINTRYAKNKVRMDTKLCNKIPNYIINLKIDLLKKKFYVGY